MRVGEKLTQNFSVSEALVGSELDIVPTTVQPAVKHTALALEEVRQQLGRVPITPTSWYRSLAHNRRVGGDPKSDHPSGYAVDFVAAGLSANEVMARLVPSMTSLGIDQLIEYPTHVHVSFHPRRRASALIKDPSSPTGFSLWTPYKRVTSEMATEPGTPQTPKAVKLGALLAAIAAALAAIAKILNPGAP